MAKDLIHEAVKEAIEKANWNVTDDPLHIPVDSTVLAVDLGAERLIGAIQNNQKIAIEIKTLSRKSLLYDFYAAFGQYIIYRDALKEQEIDRTIYMAISEVKYQLLEQKPFLMRRIVQHDIKLIVVNTFAKQIVQWINH
ncbi:MAG: element excision factor XisH family protein [Bacteroidota bacterium]